MKIDEFHKYHGAALLQIAEHRSFTAINRFDNASGRGAFRVNANIGVFIKHASDPKRGEYVFTFNESQLDQLKTLAGHCSSGLFIALVCVKARQICCINMDELDELIAERTEDKGAPEKQYQIIVAVYRDKAFRVYVNAAGRRRRSLQQRKIPRNRFPSLLFD